MDNEKTPPTCEAGSDVTSLGIFVSSSERAQEGYSAIGEGDFVISKKLQIGHRKYVSLVPPLMPIVEEWLDSRKYAKQNRTLNSLLIFK